MRKSECFAQRLRQLQRFLPRSRPLFDTVLKRTTPIERHNEKRVAVLGDARLIHGHDVGDRRQLRHNRALTLEATAYRFVATAAEHLERYELSRDGLESLIDVRVATRSNELKILKPIEPHLASLRSAHRHQNIRHTKSIR